MEAGDVDPTLTLDFKGGASSKVDGGDVEPTNTKSGWGIVISLQLNSSSKKWKRKAKASKPLMMIASTVFSHQLTWFTPIFYDKK